MSGRAEQGGCILTYNPQRLSDERAVDKRMEIIESTTVVGVCDDYGTGLLWLDMCWLK